MKQIDIYGREVFLADQGEGDPLNPWYVNVPGPVTVVQGSTPWVVSLADFPALENVKVTNFPDLVEVRQNLEDPWQVEGDIKVTNFPTSFGITGPITISGPLAVTTQYEVARNEVAGSTPAADVVQMGASFYGANKTFPIRTNESGELFSYAIGTDGFFAGAIPSISYPGFPGPEQFLDTNMGMWLGSQAPTVGQKAMISSLPVTIASDQSTLPVSIQTSVSLNVLQGTVPWDDNISKLGGWNIDLGYGVAGPGTQRVVLASDQPAISVSQGTSPWVTQVSNFPSFPSTVAVSNFPDAIEVFQNMDHPWQVEGAMSIGNFPTSYPVTQSTSPWAISGPVTGTASDNSTNSTAKFPTIPVRYNAAVQSFTEGFQGPISADLNGLIRMAIYDTVAGVRADSNGATGLNGKLSLDVNSFLRGYNSTSIDWDPIEDIAVGNSSLLSSAKGLIVNSILRGLDSSSANMVPVNIERGDNATISPATLTAILTSSLGHFFDGTNWRQLYGMNSSPLGSEYAIVSRTIRDDSEKSDDSRILAALSEIINKLDDLIEVTAKE